MSEPDRPVRLTFPRCEPYSYSIMAGGRQVGKIVEAFANWEAWLWCVPGPRFTGYAGPPVVRPRLGEVREALRERVREKGEWWTAGPVLRRHADHDPALVCRPALGYGLCEVPGDEERSDEGE